MRVGIALRDDFSGSDLRRLAKVSSDAGQARRLLALAEICDGGARTDAARIDEGDVAALFGLEMVGPADAEPASVVVPKPPRCVRISPATL